jgi:hypothetical protein
MRKEAFTRAPTGRANSSIRVRLNVKRSQVILCYPVRDTQLLVQRTPTCRLALRSALRRRRAPLPSVPRGPRCARRIRRGSSFLSRASSQG